MTEGASRLEESGLTTSEPHHIPGYGGFCPQFRFRYGKTFGKMTSSLMTDQEVVSFGKNVLANTVPSETKEPQYDVRDYLVTTRIGDVKYADNMVPGYAGYVPCAKNYFGSRYREVCANSLADLESGKRKAEYRKQELDVIKDVQEGKLQIQFEDEDDIPEYLALNPKRLQTYQQSLRQPVLPSEDKAKLVISPYDLNNPDPNKTFKSGYAGFIPRSRDLLGQGFPAQCNKALHTFDEFRHRKILMDNSDGCAPTRPHPSVNKTYMATSISPLPRPSPDTVKPLYPEGTGMTPRYAGHVPGVRFRHGLTFGKSTKNTKNFQMPDVSM